MSDDFRIGSQGTSTPIAPQGGGRVSSSLEEAIEQVLRTYGQDEHALKAFEAIVKTSSTDDLLRGLRLLDEKRKGVDDPPGSGWAIEQVRDTIITELQRRGVDPDHPPRPPQFRGDEAAVRVLASGVAEAELSLDGIVSEVSSQERQKPSERITKALEDAYREFVENKAKRKLTKMDDLAKKYGEEVADILKTSDFKQLLQGPPGYMGLSAGIDQTKKLLAIQPNPNNDKLSKQLEDLEGKRKALLEKIAKKYD